MFNQSFRRVKLRKIVIMFILIFCNCENKETERREALEKYVLCSIVLDQLYTPTKNVQGALTGVVGCLINLTNEIE